MSVRRGFLLLWSIVAVGALSACGTATGSATLGSPPPVPSTVTVTSTVEGAGTTVTETETETVTETETETVTETVTDTGGGATGPSGDFTDAGNGVYWMWAEDGTFECGATQPACWGVIVQTADGCPNGVDVTLLAYPDDGTDSVTTLNTKLSTPIPANEPTTVVVGLTQDNGEQTASVESVKCQ